ncbi:MAG: Type 1 glutamine amidotransferase-like domain-containing protein [Candidatus Pacearchaeota archaeon]|jgi:peptidase E
MTTTYILHGGNTGVPCARNFELYKELARQTPDKGKILFMFFAIDKEKWEPSLEHNKNSFQKTKTTKKFNLEIANPKTEKLIEQINSTDTIYICGGNDDWLKKPLEKINNLEKLLKGKTIMGCSAGANILSKYFYRNSKQRVENGLGIIPIKVFCHYNKNKKEKLKELKSYGKNFPIYTIPEEDFIILER